MNAGNNVTGFTVLNNSVVTVDSDKLSASKTNRRSNSISEGTIKDMTVSDVSEDVVMGGKEEIKDRNKDENGDKDEDDKGENVIEGGGGVVAIDGDNQATMQVDVDTVNDTIEVNGENEVGEKKEEKEEIEEKSDNSQKEREEEGEGEGGSHRKRKRSESCVDDSITLPAIEKEIIDEERVTDTNDTVLTTSTESVVGVPDSDHKAEVTDALVAIKKDENKVEKSKVDIEKSKSIAIVSAPPPVVRSFPVRQSALTDR